MKFISNLKKSVVFLVVCMCMMPFAHIWGMGFSATSMKGKHVLGYGTAEKKRLFFLDADNDKEKGENVSLGTASKPRARILTFLSNGKQVLLGQFDLLFKKISIKSPFSFIKKCVKLKIFDIKEEKVVKSFKNLSIVDGFFSPDGEHYIVFNAKERRFEKWNIRNKKKIRTFDVKKMGGVPIFQTFSPDGKYIAVTVTKHDATKNSGTTLLIFDVDSGRRIGSRFMRGLGVGGVKVSFSQHAQFVAVFEGALKELVTWDKTLKKKFKTIRYPDKLNIVDIALSYDGKYIALFGQEKGFGKKSITILNVITGKQKEKKHVKSELYFMQFKPSEKRK